MSKVRFGLVGTGRITDWVLRGAVLDSRFEAVAICSRSEERGRAFADSHGIPKVYTDIERMCDDPQIDAIYIGTPNHTHADIAIRCMRKGKHVLCEKPLASNAREAEKMVKVARENGVILMEAMISTLSPNFRKAAQLVEKAGPVRRYVASFCQYSSKYEALKRGEVASSFDPLCSGGALMDVGTYTIWPMVALFGEPERISPHIMTYDIPGHGLTDLQGSVEFTYPGFNATVFYSKIADSFIPTEISGEGGNILLDKVHICRRLTWLPHGAPASGRGKDPQPQDLTCPPEKDEYLCEWREFIDCVLQGRESAVNTPDRSVAVMRILDAVRTAAGMKIAATGQ
ncbi:MAG: Gfo/Idh/MocA family oxidoreductase [Bacteroidales bacterium]|nr:Gfo/Idh/MocA family oxidoreductase [Bacteroidales bacterium]